MVITPCLPQTGRFSVNYMQITVITFPKMKNTNVKTSIWEVKQSIGYWTSVFNGFYSPVFTDLRSVSIPKQLKMCQGYFDLHLRVKTMISYKNWQAKTLGNSRMHVKPENIEVSIIFFWIDVKFNSSVCAIVIKTNRLFSQ